ncbi:MAG: DsbA family protein [Kofleriaceae bacterium]|nr:DsbA family protein [Kofleriaceae bacterium]MBP9206723.1 DsbA family protein [Kofleriaceae bacterium]
MLIGKRLRGGAIAAYLGGPGQVVRSLTHQAERALRRRPPVLDVYLDPGDPWSYLTAQVADRLVRAYGVEPAVHLVTEPASDVSPAPELRSRHAVRDARVVAELWDLAFPGIKEADPKNLAKVSACLVKARPAREQLAAALALGDAMWRHDGAALGKLLGPLGSEAVGAVAPALNAAYAELRGRGHYQPAMLAWGGEWFGGVDGVAALEAVLARDLGRPVAGVVAERPLAERGPLLLGKGPLTLEVWFSFRSPYSYLALEQLEATLASAGVGAGLDLTVRLRPIAPMVTRGMSLPTVKKLYLVRDAKRHADRLGIPFGNICDPLGPAVDHCLAIAHHAEQLGPAAALAFARSAMRGAWAEARDLSSYVDLRVVVERAGLDWAAARAALGAPAAAAWAAAAATDLGVVGLWGVPSFRVGDLVTWGQDRLPVLADRLRRHQAALADAAPTSA